MVDEPRHRPRTEPGRRRWAVAPAVLAAVFVAAALAAWAFPGARLRFGPVSVTFDPSRLALQAALAVLVAVVLTPAARRRAGITAIAVGAVLVAAAADSTPRRVGDGAEYMAMALQLRHGRPPALSPADVVDAQQRFATIAGFEDAVVAQPTFVGRGGAQDFPHFWIYSAAVAPWLALTDAVGGHPLRAFTVVNVALLVVLAWGLARAGDDVAAALIAAGPLVWWVDKAHAEVFVVTLVVAATGLVERHPRLALAAAGLAAAQNPATVPVLAVTAWRVWRQRSAYGSSTAWSALAIGGGLALAHGVYYAWRLGRWSGLADAVAPGVPGLRALVTPLVDPNLGVVIHAPLLVAVAVGGLVLASRQTRLEVVATVGLLLVVAAVTPNVNHGGTPGMSRYGLWLLAAASPAIGLAGRWLRGRPELLVLALMMTVLTTWTGFRPVTAEGAGGGAGRFAAWVWTRWPALDAPLPEVFAERVGHADGHPPIPVATLDCAKVLVRGDGHDAWWPFPCSPAEAPTECVASGALCYVDRGRFTLAPRQPGFGFDPVPERAWTATAPGRLADLAVRLGDGVAAVRLSDARRVGAATAVRMPLVVEGRSGTAVWLRPVSSAAELVVRPTVPVDLSIEDPLTGRVLSTRRLAPGRHDLALPAEPSLLVVLRDVP